MAGRDPVAECAAAWVVENSVTNRVLALTSVPVEVIAGDAMSKWERYGLPAAVVGGLALLLAAAD